MWGAIVGDIGGSRFEGSRGGPKDFELFHRLCTYTDDTVCTLRGLSTSFRQRHQGPDAVRDALVARATPTEVSEVRSVGTGCCSLSAVGDCIVVGCFGSGGGELVD